MNTLRSATELPRFPQVAFVLCVLCYAALVLIGFNDIEEDAFIYFRFAANIADGHGYVFNIGGERIESCSGLLWLGLITLLYQLPLHLLLSTKLLCFVFGVLCIREVLVLSQRFIVDRALALFPAFLLVASIPFYTWSMRGLETAFYWWVVLWLLDWVTHPQRCQLWWLPALALVNARPEGMFMLAAVLPYLFFCARREACFWRGSALVLTGIAAVTAWRFWYFHDVLPHPFYFKVSDDHAQFARNLLTYGWHSGWALLLLLALPGLLRLWQRRDVALCGSVLLAVLWNVFVLEDKVYNRHMGVLLPVWYIAALMLVARWWPLQRVAVYGLRAVLLGLVLYTLCFSRYVHFKDSHPAPFLTNASRAVWQAQEYWPTVGRLLRNPDDFEQNPQGLGVFNIRYNLIASVGDFVQRNYVADVVVVYDQIGQAPWYAGRNSVFIDNLGLAYRDIGFARFHGFAANSWLYAAYERALQALVEVFWPGERRLYSEEEIIARILAKQPDVIIARKGYLAKGRVSLLSIMLKRPDIAVRYQARYLLNNREIIFERTDGHRVFQRDQTVVVPPGGKVQAITAFRWCDDGSACYELAP